MTDIDGLVSSPGDAMPDERAALEEQRDFLLRSLRDLEDEQAAGDLTAADYEHLRDDYTRRAAAILHALEHVEPPRPLTDAVPVRRRRTVPILVAAALVAITAAAVSTAIRQRGAGDTITGNAPSESADPRAEAAALARNGDLDGAIARYDELLARDPTNVEALTYKGWLQYVNGDPAGISLLIDAAELEPTYPDVHAFLALAFGRLGRTDTALAELERLEALNPRPELTALAEELRTQLTPSTATTTVVAG